MIAWAGFKGSSMNMVRDGELAEREAIRARYARRNAEIAQAKTLPAGSSAEKDRRFVEWLQFSGIVPGKARVFEVGCGYGSQFERLLRLGFQGQHLSGCELLADRVLEARSRLPSDVQIFEGDAQQMRLLPESTDVVLQSTVFSSILDAQSRKNLAALMWSWVRPGGGILWYDFTYNNPSNPDVVGIPLREIKMLFPEGEVRTWRVTLAPPLARLAAKIHPGLYDILNAFPFLRTHVLCWIKKN